MSVIGPDGWPVPERWDAEMLAAANEAYLNAKAPIDWNLASYLGQALARIHALDAENAALRTCLGTILDLIENGTLVRNTKDDAKPDWTLKMLALVGTLKRAHELTREAPNAK